MSGDEDTKEKITGPVEAGAEKPSWLAKRLEEVTGLTPEEVRDPTLKRLVDILGKSSPSVLKEEGLRKHFLRLQERIIEGEVDAEQGEHILAALQKEIESLPLVEEPVKKRRERIEPDIALEMLKEIQARRKKLHEKERWSKDDIEEFRELTEKGKELREIFQGIPRARLEGFPGMERMPPAIPSVEEIGPEKYKEEFRKRITSLIEENVDQSFDANWRLVYPLETAISVLRPEHGQPDTFEFEDKQFSYSQLRKELADELAAFRAIHNHGYLHTRAENTTALISAANFLRIESIEYLINDREIAETLRKYEDLGERYQRAQSRQSKERLFSQIKKLTRKDWKGIVAGNLFKGLGEAARRDLILDTSGDFFLARIFNAKDRARSDWRAKWGRAPFPELCEAVDLEVLSFWMVALTDYRKKLIRLYREDGERRFNDFCQRKRIEGVEIDDYGKVVSASLKNARFETMRLGREGPYQMKLSSNELTLTHLDIDDAENVRKLVFNPGGLLQVPRLGVLTRDVNAVFKHLKGDHRYEWFRRVTQAVVNYYRDRNAPSIEENFPDGLRSSISKSDFPDVLPWTWERIKNHVEAMAPVLRRREMNEVLEESIGKGWKAKIGGKKAASAVGAGILRGAGEFFGSLFKDIFGGR